MKNKNKMERFLKKLCSEKSLDETQVISEWTTFNDDYTKYNKMKKSELMEICKEHGYDTSGTKTNIVDSIMNKKMAVKPEPKAVKEKVKPLQKDILSKLRANIPPVMIKRNDHGNFEHKETGLIFDRKTTEVIGRQLDDGTVVQLSRDDIDICNKYNFKYVMPFNLSNEADSTEMDEELDEELNETDLVDCEDEESEEEIEYDE
jgi:hypothetical protein